jgi:Transglycosylase SLT domain
MNRRITAAIRCAAFLGPLPLALASGAGASNMDALIAKHAAAHQVPESLVRRVIQIESRGNPRVINSGNYGLMQIRLGTARGMGYRGSAEGLLDPDINMTYAVKYLAGAYRAAGCQHDRAIANYQRGYHGRPRAACHPRLSVLSQWTGTEDNETTQATGAKTEPARQSDVLKPRVVQVESIVNQPKETTRAVMAFAVPPTPSKSTTAAADANAAAPVSEPRSERRMSKLDIETAPDQSKYNEFPKRRTKAKYSRRSKARYAEPARYVAPASQKIEEPSLLDRIKNLITPDTSERKTQRASSGRSGSQSAVR